MISNDKRRISIEVRIALGFMFTVMLMVALTAVGITHMARADARWLSGTAPMPERMISAV